MPAPTLTRGSLPQDQDILVKLTETDKIDIGRSGSMNVDNRFKTNLPASGNLYLSQYDKPISFSTHLTGVDKQSSALDFQKK